MLIDKVIIDNVAANIFFNTIIHLLKYIEKLTPNIILYLLYVFILLFL